MFNNNFNTVITTVLVSIGMYMLLPTTHVGVATTPPTADELCGGGAVPTWAVDDCYAQAGGVSK